MPEELENSVAPERTEAELDSIADSIDSPRNETRAMEKTPEKPAPETPQEQYEFSYNGKTVKGTRDQILKWAQLGYDRPQVMAKFNQEKSQFEKQRQDWEQKWGVYKEIDDFAAKNPEWFNFINDQWQKRYQAPQGGQTQPQGGQAPDPYAPKFQVLEQKLTAFERFMADQQRREEEAKNLEQDRKLQEEVQSIREQHKDLDWDSLGEDGKSLIQRVIDHAEKIDTTSFRAAFRDLLHDDLVQKAESQGKLAVSKNIQARTKLGVLGESPTPQKGMPQRTKPIRQTSYEDIESEIREELKLSRAR